VGQAPVVPSSTSLELITPNEKTYCGMTTFSTHPATLTSAMTGSLGKLSGRADDPDLCGTRTRHAAVARRTDRRLRVRSPRATRSLSATASIDSARCQPPRRRGPCGAQARHVSGTAGSCGAGRPEPSCCFSRSLIRSLGVAGQSALCRVRPGSLPRQRAYGVSATELSRPSIWCCVSVTCSPASARVF
jgi:hypothetical protein